MVAWQSPSHASIFIAPVRTDAHHRHLGQRMRDALVVQCLSASGLTPVDRSKADLILDTALTSYEEQILGTDSDVRTRQVQFVLHADFKLVDRDQNLLWSLERYRYQEQYNITTTSSAHRDETEYVQDQALRTIANLVVTQFALVLAEAEPTTQEGSDESGNPQDHTDH